MRVCPGILMLHIMLAVALLAVPLRAAAQGGGGFPRVATDAAGGVVVIPARPARVAVIGVVPGLAQVVPPDALVRLDPQADLVAALGPDVGLLVLPELYAAAYPAWAAGAAAAGVPLFQAGAITGLDAWRDWLATAGYITGRDAAARRAIRRLDVALWLAESLARLQHRERDPARVLVLTPERYTVGQGTLLTDLIAAAGGINVAAQAGYADFRQIGDPALRDLAPDVILLTPAWGADGRAAFLATPAYADLPAVAHGRVCLLPFDSTRIARPGVAVVALALLLGGGC